MNLFYNHLESPLDPVDKRAICTFVYELVIHRAVKFSHGSKFSIEKKGRLKLMCSKLSTFFVTLFSWKIWGGRAYPHPPISQVAFKIKNDFGDMFNRMAAQNLAVKN